MNTDRSDRASRQRFAADLRAIRESRNISFETVRQEIKVPSGILQELEETSLLNHPMYNRVYLRSLVRSYAEAIGLEGDLALQALDEALEGRYSGSLVGETDGGSLRESGSPGPAEVRAPEEAERRIEGEGLPAPEEADAESDAPWGVPERVSSGSIEAVDDVSVPPRADSVPDEDGDGSAGTDVSVSEAGSVYGGAQEAAVEESEAVEPPSAEPSPEAFEKSSVITGDRALDSESDRTGVRESRVQDDQTDRAEESAPGDSGMVSPHAMEKRGEVQDVDSQESDLVAGTEQDRAAGTSGSAEESGPAESAVRVPSEERPTEEASAAAKTAQGPGAEERHPNSETATPAGSSAQEESAATSHTADESDDSSAPQPPQDVPIQFDSAAESGDQLERTEEEDLTQADQPEAEAEERTSPARAGETLVLPFEGVDEEVEQPTSILESAESGSPVASRVADHRIDRVQWRRAIGIGATAVVIILVAVWLLTRSTDSPTEEMVIPVADTVAATPAPPLVAGDTIRLSVVASIDRLEATRVGPDGIWPRRYWVNQGDTLTFSFTDSVVIQNNFDKMTIMLESLLRRDYQSYLDTIPR
jgi:hypothetical protein